MAKRDFYDVLGVGKNASPDELNQPIENLQLSTTLTKIQVIKLQKINLKKPAKHTEFCQIKKKNKIMITLVMQPLKMEVEDKVVVLVVLVEQIFQIFLRIFLVILAVEGDQEPEAQITEAQI